MKTNCSHLSTTRDVIAALGGIKAVAEITGRTYQAAENWNRKPTFPSDTITDFEFALANRGLSADGSLWRSRRKVVVGKKRREIIADDKQQHHASDR